MNWFNKYCGICGMKVDKKTSLERFGKYFCSEGHAEKYAKDMEEQRKGAPRQSSGGCC